MNPLSIGLLQIYGLLSNSKSLLIFVLVGPSVPVGPAAFSFTTLGVRGR